MNINLQESKEQEISCSKDKNNTNDKQKYWDLIDAIVCVELCCCIERFLCWSWTSNKDAYGPFYSEIKY